jgi:hypothetical protein
MSLSLLKTGAIAATAVIMSISGAFAATYGTINYDTKVKAQAKSASQTVNWAEEGDDVLILDYTKKNGGWFKIKVPGPDGWVKKSAVEVFTDGPDMDDEPGVQFCFTGPLGYICVNQ